MSRHQRIALIFSVLSSVVVAANISIGVWIYSPILVAFVVSYFVRDAVASWVQVATTAIVGSYVAAAQDEYAGYVILFTSLMILFSSKPKRMLYFIMVFSLVIAALSYVNVKETHNRVLHAGLDGAFFGAYATVVWLIFRDAILSLHEKEEQYRLKYLRIIEEATSVAREALEKLEKLSRESKDGR